MANRFMIAIVGDSKKCSFATKEFKYRKIGQFHVIYESKFSSKINNVLAIFLVVWTRLIFLSNSVSVGFCLCGFVFFFFFVSHCVDYAQRCETKRKKKNGLWNQGKFFHFNEPKKTTIHRTVSKSEITSSYSRDFYHDFTITVVIKMFHIVDKTEHIFRWQKKC